MALRRTLRDIVVNIVEPSKYPRYIAIQNCHPFIERNTGDCACRVAPDARQRLQGRSRSRKFSTIFAYDLLRRSVQIAGTAIVTKPFPQFEHLIEWRSS